MKCLAVVSGGLDSLLVCKIMQKLGFEVEGIYFASPFFSEFKDKKSLLENLNIPIRVVNLGNEYLELLKNPPHGYGKNVNPCIDCHSFMFAKAKKIMEVEGFDFIVTGEVLGQRPFSQNRQALEKVLQISGLKGHLLRPLSAKLLEPTILEQAGKIDRDQLYSISGRGRREQLVLAKELGIKNIPMPAGGCLLTDPGYGQRVKAVWQMNKLQITADDYRLLKVGRLFIDGQAISLDLLANGKKAGKEALEKIATGQKRLVVISRNSEENSLLKELKQSGDLIIKMKNYPGPMGLVRNIFSREKTDWKQKKEVIDFLKSKVQYYGTKARGQKDVEFEVV